MGKDLERQAGLRYSFFKREDRLRMSVHSEGDVSESKEKLKTKWGGYDAATEVGQSWEKGQRFMTKEGIQEQKLRAALWECLFSLLAEELWSLKWNPGCE